MPPTEPLIIAGAVLFTVLIVVPIIVQMFLRNVDAGTIRIVTLWGGRTHIYRGPGKSVEVPLFTNGTTLSSKAINVDLDITDQTADLDRDGTPQPIKVRILASAIVSVGDTDVLTRTAANRYFAKPDDEQLSTLTDLLSSSGRRAINLLTHDQLFSAKSAPRPAIASVAALAAPNAPAALPERAVSDDAAALALHPADEEDDDPLAIIIRKACSRELTDLGLIFNSLNIKVVQSEVAEARRRMSAAEATANAEIVAAQQAYRSQQAKISVERSISDSNRELEQTRASNAALVAEAEIKKQQAQEIAETKRREAVAEAKAGADIVSTQQNRRAREAQLEAERAISDRQRELEQTLRVNAALVAEAEARKQDALSVQREAELRATQTAQATADAERTRIDATAKAEAEAIRITAVADATAAGIRKVNDAIAAGGEGYFRYRQVELLPQVAPAIAEALAQAKMITICTGVEGEGAAGQVTENITGVIRTVLAAQLVSKTGMLDGNGAVTPAARTGDGK
jgi:flotillin